MDNVQKAIQMAVAAFLFVFAATTAIYIYTNLMENANNILFASDINQMSAEYVDYSGITDYSRKIKRDEILMTILDIDNNKSFVDEIKVYSSDGNYTFKHSNHINNLSNIKNWLAGTPASEEYSSQFIIEQKSNGITQKTLIYK